ncbi:GrpB family protein [Komagataeibacter medellinensis]|uniref:GrpB family protein n=1 Tax=Komagataeibacter medellinensis TaxID=1177712 RepID=A0ABQ6VUA0_9PROT|nr:GrpB family protein [Komagataeibacter medellinensis]KAB8122413.1 GrpB family protein [Komagataeibacter medellinensis]
MADPIPPHWPDPRQIMTFAPGDPDENPWVMGQPPPESITLQPWCPDWQVRFAQLEREIRKVLGGGALAVEHVGSTAVTGLAAKPVIDIDCIVPDPGCEETYRPRLEALGYVMTVRERSWYGHRMFRHTHPRANLHIFGPACPEHARHILFRDWLRTHPDERERYARVKTQASIGVANVQEYNRNKQALILAIYQRIFAYRGWTDPA